MLFEYHRSITPKNLLSKMQARGQSFRVFAFSEGTESVRAGGLVIPAQWRDVAPLSFERFVV
jgi:hypothetical protein